MEVTIRETTKSEAKKLYKELIQKYIDALKREKNDEPKGENIDNIRKHSVSSILNNVASIFTGDYLHYKNVPKETIFERTTAERTKLRRGTSDEIERKEQNINNELFNAYFTDYQYPSSMYKKLSETKGAVNEFRVDSIKKV